MLIVYGLNAEKMNCERIFNLFCLYGNVVKVNNLSILGDGVCKSSGLLLNFLVLLQKSAKCNV